MARETKNPIIPKRAIPIAEILAVIENSFFEGFFSEYQTRLHFVKNVWALVISVMFLREIWGF